MPNDLTNPENARACSVFSAWGFRLLWECRFAGSEGTAWGISGCAPGPKLFLLGGSWVVINGVLSPLICVTATVIIILLVTTPEPPSCFPLVSGHLIFDDFRLRGPSYCMEPS